MKWERLNESNYDQSNMGRPERGVLEAQEGIVLAEVDDQPEPAVLLLHRHSTKLGCRSEVR